MNTRKIFCKKCKTNVTPIFQKTPDTPHYGKYFCPFCNSFLKWVPKPTSTPKHSKFTIKDFQINFCEICGRKRNQLGTNETLEIHHKFPLKEGGKDSKDNILILCTACHHLVHWVRTYFNKHLYKTMEKQNGCN